MSSSDPLIGKDICIEYYDHNDRFGAYLPRTGRVIKRVRTDNVDDWYLLKLAQPFEYEGRIQTLFLIRSKWFGMSINATEECAVFIMLIPDNELVSGDKVDTSKLLHVAWGFAKVRNI